MRAVLLAILVIAGCTDFSESVGAAAPTGTVWELETINDRAAEGRLTMTFLASGRVRGLLPCNSYTARQTAPLPWFELQDLEIGDTRCEAAALEGRYLDLFGSMDLAESAGDALLLSNPEGDTLFFRAQPPAAA
ncbi:MAG: META domain-containing protein [Pseudomonadota bacterium]